MQPVPVGTLGCQGGRVGRDAAGGIGRGLRGRQRGNRLVGVVAGLGRRRAGGLVAGRRGLRRG